MDQHDQHDQHQPHEPSGEDRLAYEVARRYYLADETKSDIGRALGLSRFKVARLLQVARDTGVVRIEVRSPDGLDAELGERLAGLYGVERVVVARPSSDEETGWQSVARAGAALLSEVVGPADVLGLPWSRTVAAVLDRGPRLPPVPVVQLCGALVLPGQPSATELARAAARLTGGQAHVFYSPLILEDSAAASVMLRHRDVAGATARFSDVTVAVVSIGAWGPGTSTIHDVLAEPARAELTAAGVVGEVMGRCFDAEGRMLTTALSARTVAMTSEELAAVPRVVGLAHGTAKAAATAAALRGGLLTVAVVDAALAAELLRLA